MQRPKTKVLGRSSGRASLYTFESTKTRRGKIVYREVDAAQLYTGSQSQPSTPRNPKTLATHNVDHYPESQDWDDGQASSMGRLSKVYALLYHQAIL